MEPDDFRSLQPRERRAHALIRDEYRLREALADHEAQRFDLATAEAVRERTEDLLETLQIIASDDEFWDDIRVGDPIPEKYDRTLRGLDPNAFELLLGACGYRAPPPPPASELVDETLAELTAALERQPDGRPLPTAVSQARRGLILTIWRVRRQIADPTPTPASPSAAFLKAGR